MKMRSALAVMEAAALILAGARTATVSEKVGAQGIFFGAQRFPALDVDGGDNIYLAMSVATAPASEHRPHSQQFVAQSKDFGVTWDNLPTTRRLTNSPGEAFGSSIAVNKIGTARAYITYHDNSTGVTQAYLVRSKKKTKFKLPINITPHSGGAFSPRVALDSNETVNVVWGDTNNGIKVVFVRSTDRGANFSSPVDVSRTTDVAFEPEIAIDPGNGINVVWHETGAGPSVVKFARSTDGGLTFSNPKRISTGSGAATEAAVATDAQGRISVIWVDESSGHAEAYYSRSTDHGATFSLPINVSRVGNGDVHKPSVVAAGDIVYVVFQNGDLFGEEDIPNEQVYLAKSSDAGATFGDLEQVSHANNAKGRAHSAAMVLDSRGVLHLSWIDASIVGNDEGLLFYCRTSNGHQFSAQQMILAVIS